MRLIVLFEEQSYQILNGKKAICLEQEQEAKQFLTDLKTVNDALPEDRKILDAAGRLINISTASPNQKQSIADIIFNSVGTD